MTWGGESDNEMTFGHAITDRHLVMWNIFPLYLISLGRYNLSINLQFIPCSKQELGTSECSLNPSASWGPRPGFWVPQMATLSSQCSDVLAPKYLCKHFPHYKKLSHLSVRGSKNFMLDGCHILGPILLPWLYQRAVDMWPPRSSLKLYFTNIVLLTCAAEWKCGVCCKHFSPPVMHSPLSEDCERVQTIQQWTH